MKSILLSALLFVFANAVTAQLSNDFNSKKKLAASSSNIDQDWLTKAQDLISESEYHFKQVAANSIKYYTANKEHRLGFILNNLGYEVSPIRYSDNVSAASSWKEEFMFSAITKGNARLTADDNYKYVIEHDKTSFTVDYPGFAIEYLNKKQGLRQNFIVKEKLNGAGNLEVLLNIKGSLIPSVEKNELLFRDESGSAKLFYRDLKVWDAEHRRLNAYMELRDNTLAIIVDDKNANYPITVDPLNQTEEWEGSADGVLPTLLGSLAVEAAYGFSVAGLGDVNADGYMDVAVGAPAMVDLISGTGTLASVGGVFVYYGSPTGLPVLPSAKLQPTTAIAGALFGFSIAGGDVTNDGRADVIVGAPLDNTTINIGGGNTATGKVGKVYVFSGASLTTTTTTPFFRLQLSGTGILQNGINLTTNALFGFSVAVTEDQNGDGKRDIIVGAPTYAGITTTGFPFFTTVIDVQSGGAFVFLTNSADTTTTIVKLEPIKQTLLNLGLLSSNIPGLLFGYSVDGLGDYNNDGDPDVVATAPAGINAGLINILLSGNILQGSAIVYYGSGSGVNTSPGAVLTASNAGLLTNLVGTLANAANLFGVSVRGVRTAAGDRNGNVLVGAPLGGTLTNLLSGLKVKTGTVSVFLQNASAPDPDDGTVTPNQILTSPRNSNNILELIQSSLLYGFSLDNVFDVNCDNIGDIIVGEPASSGVELLNANVGGGAAFVYLGVGNGLYQTSPAWTLLVEEDEFLGINATSLIGYSVAGAGKVRGPATTNKILVGTPSRTLDFGAGLLNLGATLGTIFSLTSGDNGVGKAYLFDTQLCNSVPVALPDTISTNEDTPIDGDVSPNDTTSNDCANIWSTVGPDGGAAHGSVIMNADGTYTYTPDANYNGADTFRYQLCDCDGDCDTTIVVVDVNPVNDLPVAVNDTTSTNEDTPVNGDVSPNDTPSGDGGNTWTLVGTDGGASHGSTTMNPDGSFTYTPDPNFNGSDTFKYQLCDTDGDCDTALVIVNVNPVDDLPVAVDDFNSGNEDTPISGDASINDTPSGDGGNVWSLVGPDGGASNGSVTMDTDGSYTYTPDPNFYGEDTFNYQLCDADGDCSNAIVIITVNSVDDLPIAINDAVSGNEDAPISGDASTNDTPSADGGNTWSLVGADGGALNGSVSMNNDGTFTYTPDPNFNGKDTFDYRLCDGDGDCDTAIVIVTVNAVDDLPVAVNDAVSGDEDSSIPGDASTNDKPSADGGNIWSLVGADGGALNGSVSMNNDGTFTYTPDPNFNGKDTFDYRLCDGDGDCDTAIVIVTVNAVDDLPVAVNDAVSGDEDSSIPGDASTNDTPSADGGNTWSLVGADGGASNGSVTMNNDGTFTYTPDANFNGKDTFDYQLCDADGDCDSAIVIVTIKAADDLPIAVNDAVSGNEDSSIPGDASTNDTPSGDGGNTWSLVGPDGGASNGSVTMNPDGTFTYTPDPNFSGKDTFDYRLCDGDGDCDTAIVIVTVNAVNDLPIAVNDAVDTDEDTPIPGDASTNDTPSGDGGNTWSLVGADGGASNGSVTMNNDGTFTYTPDANFNGKDTFDYQLCDADGDCDSAIVIVTIKAADDLPIAVNDAVSGNEDSSIPGDASTNDTPSGDGGNTWSLVGADGGASNGSVTMNNDGTFTYTPDPNFNGKDTFDYQLCDGDGDCDTAIVIITVGEGDDTPTAVNDAVSGNEDSPIPGDASTNDSPSADGGNTWSLVGADGGASNGSVTMNNDGTFTYTPDPNFNGKDTFDYQLCDEDGDCDSAIVIVTVNSVDDLPVAVNDAVSGNEDSAIPGDASTNDTPSADGGNTWSLVGVDGGASNGSVTMNNDGTFTYTPDPNFNGKDTFDYQLCDSDGDCDTAIVIVTVYSVDDLPVAVNDAVSGNEDSAIPGDASTNDSPSADGGNTWSLVGADGGASNGSVTMNNDGTFTYTPDPNFNGKDTFDYQLCDGDGDCDTAIVIVMVNSVNDLPVAVNDAVSGNEDSPIPGDASTNDTPSGDGGNTWSLVGADGGASNGSVTMNPDGTFTYTPDPNFNGKDTFDYQLCDGNGDCDSAIVIVMVNSVNDLPVAVNDVVSGDEDTPIPGDASTNDTPSADGGSTWSLVGADGGASNGSVTMNPDGTFTYTPDPNFNGKDTFDYQLCDGDGDCDTAIVIVMINSVNDLPVAVNDAVSGNEDSPIPGDASTNDTPSADGGNTWSLVGADGGASNGSVTMNPDGTFTYTPDPNFNGKDTFDYQLCDGNEDCDTAIVIIMVNSVNDLPVAVNDAVSGNENTPIPGDASTNDTPSGDGGNTWSLVGADGGASNGSVSMNNDGTFTYTPDANFNGKDTFDYQICDGNEDCDTAIVIVTVNSINEVPVAVNDVNSTDEDTPVGGNASDNDTPSSDGGNVWTLIGVNGGATNGSVTMNADGTYNYDPNTNFNGVDVFKYRLCDINGDCDTATVTITIGAVDDLSVIVTEVNPLCNNNSNGSFTLNVSGATGTLSYSKNNGSTFQASNTFTGLAAGVYNWVVKDAGNPTEIETGQVILDNPPVIAATTTKINPVCHGTATGSFTINASGGTGTLMYSKDNGANYQLSNTFLNLTAGTYNWRVKDENNCVKTGSVTLNNPTAISATAAVVSPDCFGNSTGTLTINASGGTAPLMYSKDNGATYQANKLFTGLAAGPYNWVVKDANNCLKTGTATVTNPPVLNATAVGTNPACNNGSTGKLVISASGGTGSLLYSKNNGGTYQSSNTFLNLPAGIYDWVVKDSKGCLKTGQTTLANPQVLSASSIHSDVKCFGQSTGSVTAQGIGGTPPYSYTLGATTNTTGVFNNLAAGNYTVTVKDSKLCATTTSQTVGQPLNGMTLSETHVNPSCGGGNDGSINLSVSGGTGSYDYLWSNSQTTQDISGLASGTYSVTVTDDNDCTATLSVTLTQGSGGTVVCNGNTIIVNTNVTINFGVTPPSYTGDPDLLPYYSYEKTGADPAFWKAKFDVGANKLLIKSGATITTTKVNGAAPGIQITGTCTLEEEFGGNIFVISQNKNGGDIDIHMTGGVTINGQVKSEATGTLGLPGHITIVSKADNITVGQKGLVQVLGVDPGGNTITLQTCKSECGNNGDITINGLVRSFAHAHGGDLTLNRPNINVVSLNGGVTINANTAEPLYDEFSVNGGLYDLYGGLLSWVRDNVPPGTVKVQAKNNITVNGHGSDPTGTARLSFGAVAAIGRSSSAPGGKVFVHSMEGSIIGNDRAFDVSGKNTLTTNYARIRLHAKVNISLNRLGATNNFNPVVDATSPTSGGKGGTNELRAFTGSITVGPNAIVSAAVPAGSSSVQGVNLLTACIATNKIGTVIPADANLADDAGSCSPTAPSPLFVDCVTLGQSLKPTNDAPIVMAEKLYMDVYPNPANEKAIIRFNSHDAGNYQIRLVDVTGKTVAIENANAIKGINYHVINVSGLAKGLYVAMLRNRNTEMKTKIVVE